MTSTEASELAQTVSRIFYGDCSAAAVVSSTNDTIKMPIVDSRLGLAKDKLPLLPDREGHLLRRTHPPTHTSCVYLPVKQQWTNMNLDLRRLYNHLII